MNAMARSQDSATIKSSDRAMDIDLEPHEWKSDRSEPEPFFGPGLPDCLAYLAAFILSVIVLHYLSH